MDERNYYMVRAKNSTEQDFDIFTKNKVVAVGWSDINFTDYKNDLECLRRECISRYYSDGLTAPSVIGKKLNEISRFCEIKANDLIIVPYWNRILLATAIGEQIYSQNYKSEGLANQQKVTYQKNTSDELKSISRNLLSEKLQRRLRVRGSTVSDLREFSDEIDSLFAKDTYSYQNNFLEDEKKRLTQSKDTLLKNICNGDTNLQTGGLGLEYLVRELLECEGYEAKVCSKRRFPGWGDADVEAAKDDRFIGTQKILVQVKHHRGFSGEHGLKQLLEIQKLAEYSDYKLVFITTARIADSVEQEAEKADVIIMDGNSLIDWIFDNINHLSEDTKQKLKISTIPQIG